MLLSFFFNIQCQGSYKSQHTERITRGAGDKKGQEREAQNSGGTETLGDLWKGEGWGGVHGVYKMDTSGTFRKENRELERGGFGVDERR